MPIFHEFCSPFHQGEEQPDTELFLQAIPFIYYATCWSSEGKVENCGKGEERGGENRSSITRRIVFHILFIL